MATLMSNDVVDGTHSIFSDHTYYGKLERRTWRYILWTNPDHGGFPNGACNETPPLLLRR